ncbi:MAG: peptidase S8 [Actinobacteria bacterium]|nr:MAG: peptidase S8 [Actinomycetota bacterium]
MRKLIVLAVITSFLLSSYPVSASAQDYGNTPQVIKDSKSVVVKYDESITPSPRYLARKGLAIKESMGKGFYKLTVKKGKTVNGAIDALEENPRIEAAQPNYGRRVLATVNDTYASRQWALTTVNLLNAWDHEQGLSNPVTVAVVDSGVDLAHPDLSGRLVAGYDFTEDNDQPYDDIGHGTHVAGIIAANANNGQGVAGVSWGAKVMPVKVMSNGVGYDWTVAQGIKWAVDNGANIINLSLGGPGYSAILDEATTYAYNHGVIVLAAAGNDESSEIEYPAGNQHVVGVGATDDRDTHAYFSNYNSTVDISAPGVDIFSTYGYLGSGHSYVSMSGTSMATPMAAGLAALVKSKYPSMSVDEVVSRLKDRADDLGSSGRDNYFGYGRINALKALVGSVTASSVKANKRVMKYPSKVSLLFTLNPGISNALVYVRRKGLKAKKWGKYSPYRTNSQGKVSLKSVPPKSSYYQFWYPGDSEHSATSKVIKIQVKANAKLKASKGVLRGSVRPRKPRTVVNLYYRRAGQKKWRLLSKIRTDRKSRFGYRYSLPAGAYKFHFKTRKDSSHLATSSNVVTAVVR